MRSRLTVLALPALIVVALVLGGCGGGGSSSTTTTAKKKEPAAEQLTKAGFISQGDAICAEVNTAIGSVEEGESETSSQTTQIANLYTGMVQSIQRLGQPSEKDGYSEFMGAAEKLAMVEGDLKKASEEEDLVAVEESSQEAAPAVEEFQSQAAVYGFEKCSEGPHAPEVTTPAAGAGAAEEPSGGVEESGGVEVLPEEEVAPEEEFIPEEEVPAEEVPSETGGAGGTIEETEERPPETSEESGGIGPG
jgi:hypothetical protein